MSQLVGELQYITPESIPEPKVEEARWRIRPTCMLMGDLKAAMMEGNGRTGRSKE